MTTIVLYGLRESLRRKMFAVVLVLTLLFLALYSWGAHEAFKDTRNFVGPEQANLDPDRLAGAIVFGLAMFATLFLGAYDSPSQRLTYTNAGHLPPLIVGRDGHASLKALRLI